MCILNQYQEQIQLPQNISFLGNLIFQFHIFSHHIIIMRKYSYNPQFNFDQIGKNLQIGDWVQKLPYFDIIRLVEALEAHRNIDHLDYLYENMNFILCNL